MTQVFNVLVRCIGPWRAISRRKYLLPILNTESGKAKRLVLFFVQQRPPDDRDLHSYLFSSIFLKLFSYCEFNSGAFNWIGTPTFIQIRALCDCLHFTLRLLALKVPVLATGTPRRLNLPDKSGWNCLLQEYSAFYSKLSRHNVPVSWRRPWQSSFSQP